jgi:uncharacterized protein YndB with AHSA1/START domain
MLREKESNTAERELTISRLLNAPRELVWEVWTQPEHIANWWGPNGFSTTIQVMDLQAGGKWDLVMHGPDGKDYDNSSLFKEIVPFKKLVYEHVSNPHFIATIFFEEQGEQTKISWHMLFDTAEQFLGVVKAYKVDRGLEQNIEKLELYLQQNKIAKS